ncbi:MAG: hypothetical protein ACI9Q3_000611, partial [Maribacter sp.]
FWYTKRSIVSSTTGQQRNFSYILMGITVFCKFHTKHLFIKTKLKKYIS